MKIWNFIIFFSIAIGIYTLINFYIYHRAMHYFPFDEKYRPIFTISFWIIVYSYLLGRLLERVWLSPVSEFFIWIGSFWMAAMIYFLLIVLFTDIFRLVASILPFMKSVKIFPSRFSGFYASIGLTCLLLIIGFLNALFPRTHMLEININKKSKFSTLKIALASDIHLGTIVGSKRFSRILNKIQSLDPDLILLAGDVVDEDLAPVIKDNVGHNLKKLNARLGVYAIPGNHEYIGGAAKAIAYLQNHGIRVLRDEVILIDEDFYLIGRDDRSASQFQHLQRKPLVELLEGVDKQKTIILMDHQPFKLEEAVQNGVDLQVSGHTHHGQLFPLNLITNKIYEKSWGYLKKGQTHIYVSSGVGTWGPPIRLGNRPEVVLIKLKFLN